MYATSDYFAEFILFIHQLDSLLAFVRIATSTDNFVRPSFLFNNSLNAYRSSEDYFYRYVHVLC